MTYIPLAERISSLLVSIFCDRIHWPNSLGFYNSELYIRVHCVGHCHTSYLDRPPTAHTMSNKDSSTTSGSLILNGADASLTPVKALLPEINGAVAAVTRKVVVAGKQVNLAEGKY